MLAKSNGAPQANATKSVQPAQQLAKNNANTTNQEVILKKGEKEIKSNNTITNATVAQIPK